MRGSSTPLAPFEPSISETSNSGEALSLRKVMLDEVARNFPKSCNLAAYVNRSNTLRQFLKLGVDLSVWDEKPDVAELILKLDFERDVAERLRFLHDVGVSTDQFGRFLTKNPYIFREDPQDLQVRINYLRSKKFSELDIARIVSVEPYFLLRTTEDVDRRLGFLQKEFGLSGDEVRFVATRKPGLITRDYTKLKENQFILKEEFGFEPNELRQLLKTKPKLWIIGRKSLRERFDYVHNKMGISHEQILHFPGGLLRRLFALKQRHLFLIALGRSQYDPKRENYVSLKSIVSGSDAEFCTEVAKSSVEKFNEFLKTL